MKSVAFRVAAPFEICVSELASVSPCEFFAETLYPQTVEPGVPLGITAGVSGIESGRTTSPPIFSAVDAILTIEVFEASIVCAASTGQVVGGVESAQT